MFYSKDASPIRKNGDGSGLLPLSLDPKYLILPLLTGEGIWRIVGLPGILCPTCASHGQEVWVIPGRACGYCSTPALHDSNGPSYDDES